MSSENLVSVIVPTYNRAHLLPAALESALGQSHPHVEVVVIDDGSTDNTKQVVEPFLDRIIYLETENGGPAHARNIGMRAASGRYLAFLDSDDLYLPGKLALQVAFMEAVPEIGLVSTEVSAFDESGVLEEYHLKSYHRIWRRMNLSYDEVYENSGEFEWEGRKEPVSYYLGNIFRYALMDTLISENTVFFRREVLDTVGFQNERYLYGQGYEWLLRVLKNYRAGFLNLPTYQLRYHRDQHSMCQAYPGDRTGVDPDADLKKQRILPHAGETVLSAVLEWGCDDAEFYARNRSWLDRRVAELYHSIGQGWMEIGNRKKARESFRDGMKYDHRLGHNRRWFFWSFLPLKMRPLADRVEKGWHTFRARQERRRAPSGS